MITVETYPNFVSGRVEIRFFDGDKRIGKVYCGGFGEIPEILAHYERVFGSPVKFPEV